jgi:hypothetical protein
MAELKVSEWQAPPVEREGAYRKGWCDELVQNGDRLNNSLPGFRTVNADIRMLMGGDQDENYLKSNSFQSDIRTFVETVTDLRQIATFGSRAQQFKKNVGIYNDALKYTFWDSGFLFAYRYALQYAMLGRGYIWTKFSRNRYGWGKGRNVFDWLGPFEVLLEQIPPDNDPQGCYAATIIRAMPIAEAHARFPQWQEYLTPISRYDWTKYSTMGGIRLDFWDRHRFSGETRDWDNRYCEIRYHFIRDLRMNESGRTFQMGVEGSTWGYTVPSYGDLLTWTNPWNGLPESRKATEEDCRVYPQLRLMITCPSVPEPMYDDTAFDWHGEIPVAPLDVNDWAWSPVGYSTIRNVAGLVRAQRAGTSRIDEVLAIRKDPPTGYDFSTGVARTQIEKLDLLRSQGVRVGLKGDPKKAVVSILPDSIVVDGEDWKGQEFYDAEIKKTLGLTDISSMRDLKMNLSDQSFEKAITNLGPIGKGIALNTWKANGKIANLLKYNIPQYIPVDELQRMLGPEAVGLETFDNDPNSLIPGRLPGEDETRDSRFTRRQRAQWFAEQLNVVSTPAQLLNVTQMQEKMLYMFFLQKGVPVSMATTMEKLGVQGWETELDKWKAEQISQGEWELEKLALMQKKAKELGIELPQPGGPGQGHGGGRPGTSQKPPHGAVKGSESGEVRAVNKQS